MDEDWDEEFGFSAGEDDSASLGLGAAPSANRIIGICAERFVANQENKWDDDFAFDRSDGSGDLFEVSPLSPTGLNLPTDGEKKGDSTTNDATDLDDWEDWDAELGIDTETSAAPLANLIDMGPSTTQGKTETGPIPSRYTLIPRKSDLVIVKFPRLPLLYTLKDKEGHRLFLTEDDFSKWTGNLMRAALMSARSSTSFEQLKATFHQQKMDNEPFSPEWIRAHTSFCMELKRMGEYGYVLWETILQFFMEIQKDQFQSFTGDKATTNETFLLYMVHLACQMWVGDEDDAFTRDILGEARQLMPHQSHQIDLLQAECYAHHLEEAQDMGKEPLRMFVDLYCRPQQADPDLALQLRAQILIDVHLYATCHSPLTTSRSDTDPESRQEELAALRLEKGRQAEDLLLGDIRMSTLTDIYRALPLGFLKGKAAFVLAMADEMDAKDNSAAERKYLEALYLLHHAAPSVAHLLPIVSELGSNALYAFASKLELQSKYTYAILVYHACGQVLQLRGCTKEYFTLLRKMAAVSKEYDDYNRALSYYKELLQHYIEGQKVNEIIYVSDILSRIYADVGRFDIAEEYLLGAFSKLPRRQRVTSNPATFQIQFSLAKLYLSGFFYERGILLLEHLMASPHPRGKENSIISALAQGYIKKRRFKDCEALLTHTPLPPDTDEASRRTSSKHKRNKSLGRHMAASGPQFHHSLPKKSSSFHELSARNYLHACQYEEAINAIDAAIHSCTRSNFNALGNHFYLRGKIFQAVCSLEECLAYPARLVRARGEFQEHVYTCAGDVLQESIACYRKAYKYFCAIGDDVRQTKALTRIAQTYLDAVFTPLMHQHQAQLSVCQYEYFEVSNVLYKPGVDFVPLREGHLFRFDWGTIDVPAKMALDSALEFSMPLLILQGFLNMAEVRLLQKKPDAAQAFWKEAAASLFNYWIIPLAGRYAPVSLLCRIHTLLKRCVRVLLALPESVVQDHLVILDSLPLMEMTIQQARALPPPLLDAGGSNSLFRLVSIHNARISKRALTDPSKSQREKEAARRLRKTLAKRQLNSSRLSTTVRNFFDDKEGIDWASISEPLEVDNEVVVQAYSALHCIKSLLGRYSSRKQSLEKEVIFERNQKQLRLLAKYARRARDLSGLFQPLLGPSAPEQPSPSAHAGEDLAPLLDFATITARCPAVEQLLYALHIDGCIMTYSPARARTSALRLLRVESRAEGKEEPESGSGGGAPSVPAAEKRASEERQKVTVRVSLLHDDLESGLFEVKPLVTVEEFLSFLCDTFLWSHSLPGADERTRKPAKNLRSLMNSKALRIPIKPIDSSKGFGEHISALVEETLPPPGPQDAYARAAFTNFAPQVTLALRARTGSDSTLRPLQHQMDTPLSALCTTPLSSKQSLLGANLLDLCVYTTAMRASVMRLGEEDRICIGRSLTPSSEAVHALRRLVQRTDKTDHEEQSHRRALELLCRRLQADLAQSMPHPPRDHLYRQRLLQRAVDAELTGSQERVDVGQATDQPVLLVCSSALQVLPWESLMEQAVVRSATLCNGLHREKYRRLVLGQSGSDLQPTFLSFSYASSAADRAAQGVEDDRRKAAAENALAALRVTAQPQATHYGLPMSLPFQSPVRRKKAFTRNFLSLTESKLEGQPAQVIDILEGQPETNFHVFLLSYADLVEMNSTTTYLLSCACNCCLVFAPRSHMKTVIQRLLKLQVPPPQGGDSPNEARYHHLISAVQLLQRELLIPIAIFNSP